MRQIGMNLRGGIGAVAAAAQARHRALSGTQIVYDGLTVGKSYAAVTESLQAAERALVPDDMRNAADADLRVFNASAADFVDAQGAPAWPKALETVTWQGTAYTVLSTRPDEAGGVSGGPNNGGPNVIGLRILVYRTPPTAAQSAGPSAADQLTVWTARQPKP